MDASLFDPTAPMKEAPASSASEEPTMSRTAVGVGVGCVAALVGYTLYCSSLPTPPQALANPASASGDEGTPVRLACVNFTDDEKTSMSAVAPTIRPVGTELDVSYPTVTFYDDDPDTTIDGLRQSTRRAARFAFHELNRKPSGCRPTACVFLQSAAELDGEPLEAGDTNARLLRYAEGRCLRLRRCLAFSANGEGAEVVEWELCGVVDSRRARSRWPSAEVLERQNTRLVLEHCCIPSESSFTAPPRRRRHMGQGTDPEVQRIEREDKRVLIVPTMAQGTDVASRDAGLGLWWQSALPVCVLFATAIRYARTEDGGLAVLLASSHEGQSPLVRLQQITRGLLTRCGVTSASPTSAPSSTEAVHCCPTRGASAFAIALLMPVTIASIEADAAVPFWEAQISAIVAKVSQRRSADVATRVCCGTQAGSGTGCGVVFELTVPVTLVEAVRIALDAATVLAWSGVAPAALRIASRTAPSAGLSALGYIPFKSGCADLLSTSIALTTPPATSGTLFWNVLTEFH